jgi:hypothetical protein
MITLQTYYQTFITTDTFLAISAKINYLLAPEEWDLDALTSVVLGKFKADDEFPILRKAIQCLRYGYQEKKRKLGPQAIIHPLRVTALLTHVMVQTEPPSLLDLLCTLLHDKDEDLTPTKVSAPLYAQMEHHYAELLSMLTPEIAQKLRVRVHALTHHIDESRTDNQSYYQYLWDMMEQARACPELLHVKLADRIDNTLDTHVQRGATTRYDFYRILFDKFFSPVDVPVRLEGHERLPDPTTGALRLQQFYKNIIMLSMLRRRGLDKLTPTTACLFTELANVSIRETQQLVLKIFSSELRDFRAQREVLFETLEYCRRGGLSTVTTIGSPLDADLDGALTDIFSHALEHRDKSRLYALFQQPKKLGKLMLAFMGVFSGFIHNDSFYLKGITPSGLDPYGD